MAKITGYGFWIDIKSLKREDKKNWIICLITAGIAGGLAGYLGVALSETGIEALGGIEENGVYIWLSIIEIACIYVSVYTYIKVLKNQDQLFQKYNEMTMIGGAVGFLLVGIPIAILSPFVGYDFGFIDLFLGFTLGASINSYRFYKNYIKED